MKIAVCFKLIPDYEQLPSDAWKASSFLRPTSNLPDTRYAGAFFGFFDEGALETALRIKDTDNTTVLEAISLGKEYKTYTEYLYANGYDRVCYLKANSDFDSKNTATELASYIKNQKYDLILMGESVGPMDSGCVPFLVSHMLSCPVVNHISDIRTAGGKLTLIKETESNIERYESDFDKINTPLIAVISNAKHPYLRLATYASKEKAKHLEADIQSANDGKCNVKFELPKTKARGAKTIDKEDLGKILIDIKGGEMP